MLLQTFICCKLRQETAPVELSGTELYRVFFFLWIQSGGCKTAILMSFKQFLYFLHSKLWAHFHFGTFDP